MFLLNKNTDKAGVLSSLTTTAFKRGYSHSNLKSNFELSEKLNIILALHANNNIIGIINVKKIKTVKLIKTPPYLYNPLT